MSETLTRFAREMIHINDNVFYLSLSVLFIVFVLLVAYWFYTRRKMQELQHQIPAEVIKNYLDSVIQNSNALKSSLFRGGGLDVADGIPSIVPTGELAKGGVGVSAEEIAQKNAEIAALQGQIGSKDSQIRELERQLAEGFKGDEAGEKVIQLQSENAGLKADLEAARAEIEALKSAANNSGADNSAELDELKKKNSELEASLEEYSVISEDLANLRRLQQENDQLKKTIEEMKAGGAPAPEAVAEAAPEPTPEPTPEPEAAPEPAAEAEIPAQPVEEDDGEAAMAAAIAEQQAQEEPAAAEPEAEQAQGSADDEMMVPSNEGEQKSAEELLSEFEKMLG